MDYSVVIPCAGMGKRMGLGYNKLLMKMENQTLIEKTVKIFMQDPKCKQIILVISTHDEQDMNELFKKYPQIEMTYGGKERQDSVYQGLLKVKEDYVLVHDGARPYLKQEFIDRLLTCLNEEEACLLMVKAKDTMKIVEDGYVKETIPRQNVMHAQTPQAFRTQTILKAHQYAIEHHLEGTDDSSLVEMMGIKVKVVEGDFANIKITTMEDLR